MKQKEYLRRKTNIQIRAMIMIVVILLGVALVFIVLQQVGSLDIFLRYAPPVAVWTALIIIAAFAILITATVAGLFISLGIAGMTKLIKEERKIDMEWGRSHR